MRKFRVHQDNPLFVWMKSKKISQRMLSNVKVECMHILGTKAAFKRGKVELV